MVFEFSVDYGKVPQDFDFTKGLVRPERNKELTAIVNRVLYSICINAGEIPYYRGGIAGWPFQFPDTLDSALKDSIGGVDFDYKPSLNSSSLGTIMTANISIALPSNIRIE